MTESKGNKPIVMMLLVILAAIFSVVIYLYKSKLSLPSTAQTIEIQKVIEQEEERPNASPSLDSSIESKPTIATVNETAEKETGFVLPLLDDSDELIRNGMLVLTRHTGVNKWLAPKELIRKFVAFTSNISEGQLTKEPVRSLALEGPFSVISVDEKTFEIDPASYERYEDFVEVAVSFDAARAAEFYRLLSPLFQSAYEELGFGEQRFDDVMFRAIGRLLETPSLDFPVRLIQPVVMYEFEDPKLEAMSAAQKQLIRMGPKNTRLLQDKIGEVARELRTILSR